MVHALPALKTWRSLVTLAAVTVSLGSLLFFTTPAHAADRTWTGAIDADASKNGNWSANIGAGDTLVIDSTATTIDFPSTFATSGLAIFLKTGFTGSVTMSTTSISFTSSTIQAGVFNTMANTTQFTANVTVSGGTVSSTVGTIDFNGNLTVNSGTVNLGNATAAADVTLGGTFAHGTDKTLTFDGAADQTFTSASSTVYNLTIANTGSTSTIEVILAASSGGLRVNGTLALNDGELDITTNGVSLYLAGNVTADNTNGSFSVDSGTRTVAWIGSGTQTIDGQAGDFGGGHINWGNCIFSGSGTYQPIASTTMKCDSFTLNSGTFDPRTNSNAVTLYGSLAISNGATFSSSTANLTLDGLMSASTITDNTNNQLSSKQDLGTVVIANTNGVSTATSTRMYAVTVNSSVTFNISGDPLMLGGTGTVLTNNGTFTDNATSKVYLKTSGSATIPARTYLGTVELAGTGIYTAASSMTVASTTISGAGTMVVSTGVTYTASTVFSNDAGYVTQTGTGKVVFTNTSTKVTNSAGTETADFATGAQSVYLRVADADANISATSTDTMSVTLTTSGGKFVDTETVTLTETSAASGIFLSAGIPFKVTNSALTSNGVIEVNGNGTLNLAFTDSVDSSDTGSDTATYTGESVKNLVAPTNVSISINAGAASTKSSSVTLSLGGVNALNMVLSNDPTFAGATWESFAASKSWKLASGTGERTVYVIFESGDGSRSNTISDSITVSAAASSDAPAATPAVPAVPSPKATTPVPTPEKESATPAAPPIKPPAAGAGMLVKLSCPSGADGAHLCRAVYVIGKDGKRHAFPHSKVYFTWYKDFSNIQVVTPGEMAQYRLGKNVGYRPGVRMVKFTTDPAVYSVVSGGMLRKLANEKVAAGIYGGSWNRQIDDVSDAFFGDYTFGSIIESAESFIKEIGSDITASL